MGRRLGLGWAAALQLMYALTVITPPAEEPISLEQAKMQCRVDGTEEHALLDALITAARQHLDPPHGWLGRALLTQTLSLTLDQFPCSDGVIVIPAPPLQSVTSITYVDQAGATQTVSSADYQVDIKSEPGRVMPAPYKTWPYARDQFGAVTVTYKAGYASADLVPGPIKSALLLMVASLYANREAPLVITPAVDALLASYRISL